MADYVLTIDQGTTGSRAIGLDAEAKAGAWAGGNPDRVENPG